MAEDSAAEGIHLHFLPGGLWGWCRHLLPATLALQDPKKSGQDGRGQGTASSMAEVRQQQGGHWGKTEDSLLLLDTGQVVTTMGHSSASQSQAIWSGYKPLVWERPCFYYSSDMPGGPEDSSDPVTVTNSKGEGLGNGHTCPERSSRAVLPPTCFLPSTHGCPEPASQCGRKASRAPRAPGHKLTATRPDRNALIPL